MRPLRGQLDLFAPAHTAREQMDEDAAVRLNRTVEDRDVPRLTAAVRRLVDRLREGPATGDELEAIAGRRFSARLGEARDSGLIKGWRKQHVSGGTWQYELIGE